MLAVGRMIESQEAVSTASMTQEGTPECTGGADTPMLAQADCRTAADLRSSGGHGTN
jgi:hypothetical protein